VLQVKRELVDSFSHGFHNLVKPVNERLDREFREDLGALERRNTELDEPNYDTARLSEHTEWIEKIPQFVLGNRRITFR
jgi:hypothetical protein